MMGHDIAIEHEIIWRYLSAYIRIDKKWVLQALDAIEAEGKFTSYEPLTALCVTNNEIIRWRAWTVLTTKLPQIKRKWIWYCWHENSKDKPTMLSLLGTPTDTPTNVLGIISANANGHVREGALRVLQQRYDGAELAFLIVRSNDWVPQIRQLATHALQNRLPRADYAKVFVQELPLLYRLWDTKRGAHKELQQSVESLLTSHSAIPHLLNWLETRQDNEVQTRKKSQVNENSLFDRQLKRYALALLFKSPEAIEPAIRQGLRNEDPVVRTRAAKAALEKLPEAEIPNLVASLLQDRLSAIRKEALRWIAARDWPDRDRLLIEGLFDSNGGVRNLARYYLKDKKDLDITELYKRELKTDSSKAENSLLGLSEFKCTIPLVELQHYLESNRKRIRAAAYQASFAGDLPGRLDLALKALQDPSAEIVRLACAYLGNNAVALDGEKLWTLLSAPGLSPGSRKAILKLICKLNKWDSLYYLLRATALVQNETVERAADSATETARHSSVDYWSLRDCGPAYVGESLWDWIESFNRTYDQPSNVQKDRCKEALSEYRMHIHPRLAQELDQILR
jgi:hypothetical protein